MDIMKAFRRGFSLVSENMKMIPIIYIVNLGVATLLAIPMFATLNKSLGYHGVRERMLQNFDYDWWSTFNLGANSIEKTIRPSLSSGFGTLFDNLQLLLTGKFNSFGIWILVFGVVYLILAAFLNGGVIGIYADEKRSFSVSRFFSNSGYYFHHFFALLFAVVILFFLVYKFLSPAIFGIIDGLSKNWMSDRNVWFVNLIGYIFLLLVIVFFNMIFDYAKIILVVEKKKSSWLCIWLALKFAARHLIKTSGLYFLLSAVGLGLVLVFGLLQTLIQPTQIVLLIVVIAFQQIFIFLKIGLRLDFYGAQMALYQQDQSSVRKLRKV